MGRAPTTVWGTFTAFLRPAAGESWYELWERGGNYAMPLALLLLIGRGGLGAPLAAMPGS